METTELLERIETLDRKVKRHRKFSINLCERLAKLESFLDGFEGGAAFESIKQVVEPQPREWRVDALAELVKDLARQQREDFQRMDFYEITVQELDRIMEGRA